MDANGLIKTASADQARFDHRYVNGQVESLGLLVEEQRTNLLTYSEQFDNAAWVKVASTVGINSITAPDGTLTADKLTEDNTDNIHRLGQRYTKSASEITYTLSIFVKKAERRYFEFGMSTENSFVDAFFDMNTKSFLYSAPVIFGTFVLVDYGSVNYPNDWVRVYVTATTDTLTYVDSFFGVYATDGSNTYQGDGTSGIYIWGAQLEEGYFPTSYIPTTTATATRSIDYARITGTNFSSWYNQTEGTISCEFDFLGDNSVGGYPGVYYVDDGTNANCIGIWKYDDKNDVTSTYDTYAEAFVGGGTGEFKQYNLPGDFVTSNIGVQITPNVFAKTAHAYKQNNIGFSANGSTASTDTSANIPTVNRLLIGNLRGYPVDYSSPMSGHIRQLSYYPTRLSNTLLQNLTK
jgi:hypothetical protein